MIKMLFTQFFDLVTIINSEFIHKYFFGSSVSNISLYHSINMSNDDCINSHIKKLFFLYSN